MIIDILIGLMLGSVIIKIEGDNIERFINICKKSGIKVWKLRKYCNNIAKMNINVKNFKEVCKIGKKLNVKVKILKKIGIPFFINKYKKRKIFLVFLIITITFIMIASNYIWNVEIINPSEIEDIEKYLREEEIYIGRKKNKINVEEVVNNIRIKQPKIAWIGIEIKGTNAIVKIVKKEEEPQMINENEICNIVSNKRGIITKISAQNGTVNVKEGDMVKEGDVLIKGWMEGKYTGVRYMNAEGEIEARVSYEESIKIPYEKETKIRTGAMKKTYGLKINKLNINLDKRLLKFEKYDTIETKKQIKIGKNLYLPITVVKNTFYETKNKKEKYSKEEAKVLGVKMIDDKIIKMKNDNIKIINHKINTYEEEKYIEIIWIYEVLENIGTKEKIMF